VADDSAAEVHKEQLLRKILFASSVFYYPWHGHGTKHRYGHTKSVWDHKQHAHDADSTRDKHSAWHNFNRQPSRDAGNTGRGRQPGDGTSPRRTLRPEPRRRLRRHSSNSTSASTSTQPLRAAQLQQRAHTLHRRQRLTTVLNSTVASTFIADSGTSATGKSVFARQHYSGGNHTVDCTQQSAPPSNMGKRYFGSASKTPNTAPSGEAV
jgi:hypothetical protein